MYIYVKSTRDLNMGRVGYKETNSKRDKRCTPGKWEIGGIINRFVKEGAAIVWIQLVV
jgi:hypothetical protein